MEEVFRRYSTYLKQRYGKTAYRIAVDAGFSCPNRSADRIHGGCSYCDEFGSRAAYTRGLSDAAEPATGSDGCTASGPLDPGLKRKIHRQIDRGIEFLGSRYQAEVFLLYFQAFSNTDAPVEWLSSVYDFGLSLHDFRELIVATRPDCVDPGVAALLASYRTDEFDVWVELGLQSACDLTLRRINRGHTVADFDRAFRLLRDSGVRIACHLIFGLPGEDRDVMMQSVDHVARLRPDAVKLHDLHVPINTPLYTEYLEGELSVASGGRHVSYLVDAIERLPPETVIMRLGCDTPADRRAAPRRPVAKSALYGAVERELRCRGTVQGERSGGRR